MMTNLLQAAYSTGRSIFQETRQIYYAKYDFEQNKNKLSLLITEMTERLNIIQQDYNIQESIDNSEYQQLIQELQDLLAQSSNKYNSLPTQLGLQQLANIELYNRNINQDLLDTFNQLEDYKNKVDYLVSNTRNIMQTVILRRPSQQENSKQFLLSKDQIYKIQIRLILKAPRQIKDIFDAYPYHLNSEYKFELEMEDSGSSNQNVHIFRRSEFFKLASPQSKVNVRIQNLSQKNHCTLKMKNRLNFPQMKNRRVLSNLYAETPTAAPEEQSDIFLQWDSFNFFDKFQLFLVVNGKNGVEIIRDKRSLLVESGQELELQVKDQIVLLQKTEGVPLLSYVVQNIHITKKQDEFNFQNQQN